MRYLISHQLYTARLTTALWRACSAAALQQLPSVLLQSLQAESQLEGRRAVSSRSDDPAALSRHASGFQKWKARHATDIHRLEAELAAGFDDHAAPGEIVGDYMYHAEQTAARPLVHYWRQQLHSQQRQTVLDLNDEQCCLHGCDIMNMKMSPSHQRAAFAAVRDGSPELLVLEVEKGRAPLCTISGPVGVEWATDDELVYVLPDDSGRPSQVFRQDLAAFEGREIFQETDPTFFVAVSKTKDGQFLLISSTSKTSSEVWAVSAHAADRPLHCICPRIPGTTYFAEHHDPRWLLLRHQAGESDYSLLCRSSDALDVSNKSAGWQVLLSPCSDVATSDMDIFQDHCVLYQRHSLQPMLTVLQLPSAASHGQQHSSVSKAQLGTGQVQARRCYPDARYTHLSPGMNMDYSATTLSCTLESPALKPQRWQLDLLTGQWMREHSSQQDSAAQPGPPPTSPTHQAQHSSSSALASLFSGQWHGLWAQQQKPCQEESSSTVHHAASQDGTAVPLTLTQPAAGIRPSGQGLLYVYGAYSLPLDRTWSPLHGPLLARGWVIAHAHIRGGGDMGRHWHAAATRAGLPRRVEDLQACLHYLHKHLARASGKASVVLHATSAGGVPAGALLNTCPEAVTGAVLHAPLLDLSGVMDDPDALLTQHEYAEWGDPSIPVEHAVLQRTCPLTNLRPARYASLLVSAAIEDDRIPLSGPVAYIDKVAECCRSGRPKLLHLRGGGHFQDEQGSLPDLAAELHFILSAGGQQ